MSGGPSIQMYTDPTCMYLYIKCPFCACKCSVGLNTCTMYALFYKYCQRNAATFKELIRTLKFN